MEHTITNTPWNDNDPFAEERERDEAVREADDSEARERGRITNECKRLGWKPEGKGFASPGFQWHVELSGNSGFVWSLEQFSDGDIRGVATAHWVDAVDADGDNIEGDTLEEFELALRFLNKPAVRQCNRFSRFPADWNVDHEAAAMAREIRTQHEALADEADRQYHADVEEGF